MSRTTSSTMLALLLVCATAQASEWVSFGRARGEVLEGFIDNSSIRVMGNVRRAWIKLIYAPHTVRGFEDNAKKWQSYSVSRVAYNCIEESSRTEALNIYFDDGTTLIVPSARLQPSWESAPPDTVVSAEMQFICAWKPK
jgi:hypothetical protein